MSGHSLQLTTGTGLLEHTASQFTVDQKTLSDHINSFRRSIQEAFQITVDITPTQLEHASLSHTENQYTYQITPKGCPTLTALLDIALQDLFLEDKVSESNEQEQLDQTFLRENENEGYSITITISEHEPARSTCEQVSQECTTYRLTNSDTFYSGDAEKITSTDGSLQDVFLSILCLCEGLRFIRVHSSNRQVRECIDPHAPSLGRQTGFTSIDVQELIDDFYHELTIKTPVGWRIRWMISVLENISTQPSQVAAAARTPVPETAYVLSLLSVTDILTTEEASLSEEGGTEMEYSLSEEYIQCKNRTDRKKNHIIEQQFLFMNISGSDINSLCDRLFRERSE